MTNPSPETCRNGHPRNHETTYRAADGSLNCRPCRAAATRRYRSIQPEPISFPFDTLADWIRRHYDREASVRNLVELCSVSQNRACSWQRSGRVNLGDADHAAIRLGRHPVEIWPEWFEGAA